MKSQTQWMLRRLRLQGSLKRLYPVSLAQRWASLVLRVASDLSLENVANAGMTMLKPDLTKDIKPDDTNHKDWCATNFTTLGECDCEDKK
jgi:hypothetical protein